MDFVENGEGTNTGLDALYTRRNVGALSGFLWLK